MFDSESIIREESLKTQGGLIEKEEEEEDVECFVTILCSHLSSEGETTHATTKSTT